MKLTSVLIAIEKYADQNLRGVKYAAEDTRQLADALNELTSSPTDLQTLLNEQATKTAIESVIRTTLKRLSPADTFLLFYAGQGFSHQAGEDYLACCDSRMDDLEETSLSLNWLFKQLERSACKRIALFLDASPDGLFSSQIDPSSFSSLNQTALAEFFLPSDQGVCFSSCQTGETSHVSSTLKQGIWSYHLCQAFAGHRPEALIGDQITATSLQSYLTTAVPVTLRKTSPQSLQKPQWFGAISTFPLADLSELFARRQAAQHPHAGQVKDSILLAESIASIKSLSGFKKNNKNLIPDRHNSFAQSFINEIAAADLQADVEGIRAALKREFNFTRLQLTVANHGEGNATITTPYFNYNVSIEQAPGDPASVLWRRSVDAIIDPEKVLSNEFERVFATLFDTVELSLHDHVPIEQLIDFIESLSNPAIKVDYAHDQAITACVVRLKGHPGQIKVAANRFSVVHPKPSKPKQLLDSLFKIQHALTRQHQVQLIPFAK